MKWIPASAVLFGAIVFRENEASENPDLLNQIGVIL